MQLSTPLLIGTVASLSALQMYTRRPVWWQIGVVGAWPLLSPGTYYHAVLSPGSPLPPSSASPPPNGIYWCGLPHAAPQLPATIRGDPLLFTGERMWRQGGLVSVDARLPPPPPPPSLHPVVAGRQLVSQPTAADSSALYGAASTVAVAYLRSAQNWSSLGPRFTTWAPLRQVRYGVQVIGPVVFLSSTSSEWRESPEPGDWCLR